MTETNNIKPEFNHSIHLGDVRDDGKIIDLTATASERAAVSQRLGILDVLKLESDFRLYWVDANSLLLSDTDAEVKGEVLCLEGRLRATVTQACVLTLEPVTSEIVQEFIRHYGEGDPRHKDNEPLDLEIFQGHGGFAQIEMVNDGRINLGEVVVEELSLSLDPYPRADGVTLEDELADGGHDEVGTSEDATDPKSGKESPFSVLEKLRQQLARKREG